MKEATVVKSCVDDTDLNVLDESKDSTPLEVLNGKDSSWEDGVTVIKEVETESNVIDSGLLVKESLAEVDALMNVMGINGCSVFANVLARLGVIIMFSDACNVRVLFSEISDA